MNDLVSYFTETGRMGGGLFRRRPFPERDGSRDDEVLSVGGVWRATNSVRDYEAGREYWDAEFYGIQPDEAEQIMAYLREPVEVRRNGTVQPPVLCDWSIGDAWQVRFKGELSDQAVGRILDGLGMTRRAGSVSHWRETDFGLRVLRSDTECRWYLDLHKTYWKETWLLRLRYLRLAPDEDVVREFRDRAHPLIDELGLEIDEEKFDFEKSVPCTENAAKNRPPAPPPEPRHHVRYQAFLEGRFTRDMLHEFRDTFGLERTVRMDDEDEEQLGEAWWTTERGGQMSMDLSYNGARALYISLDYRGVPDPDAFDQRIRDIRAAVAQAGLTVTQEINKEVNS
jgi:hypothetical protein